VQLKTFEKMKFSKINLKNENFKLSQTGTVKSFLLLQRHWLIVDNTRIYPTVEATIRLNEFSHGRFTFCATYYPGLKRFALIYILVIVKFKRLLILSELLNYMDFMVITVMYLLNYIA
jgi:hypothetical protein